MTTLLRRAVVSCVVILVLFAGSGLLSAAPLPGESWISLGSAAAPQRPEVRIVESSATGMRIEVLVPGFLRGERLGVGGAYDTVRLPYESRHLQVGAPAVPRIVRRIAVPPTADVRARVVVLEEQRLSGIRVEPVQPPHTDRDDADQVPFVLDEELYGRTSPWPEERVEVGRPQIMRDVRFVELSIYPLQVISAQEELLAATRLEVELSFLPGSTDNPLTRAPFPVSPRLRRVYEAAFLNGDRLDLPLATRETPTLKYVVVCADILADTIQPLVDWYNKAGLATELALLSEIGSSFAEIKAYLQDRYDSYGIEFALLVGDTNLLPIGSHSGDPSDHMYGLLAGSDDTLDIAVGRFSTIDAAGLEHQVAKTLNYIFSVPQDDWPTRSILAAHEEQYPGKYTQCKNEIKDFPYSLWTPEFETAFPPEGATRQQVIDAIENGNGIVN